jgi:hypothetical protein
MRALLLLLLCLCAGARIVEVPAVEYVGLVGRADGGAEAEGVRRALALDGLLQVRGVPGLGPLRRRALALLAQCVAQGEGLVSEVVLADGAVRRTLAAATQLGREYGFELDALFGAREAVPAACTAFERESAKLRGLVTRVSGLVFAQLDALCGSPWGGAAPLARAAPRDYDNAWQLLSAGEHLEHFHAYAANCSGPGVEDGAGAGAGAGGAPPSLALHTDEGLMLAMVPPLLRDARGAAVEGADPAVGFYVEDARGRVSQPRFADDGDVLVFMLGDAVNEWFAHCPVPLRAVPHSLVLSETCAAGASQRLWYGRMFLPPHNAVSPKANRTFGELRRARVAAAAAERAGGGAARRRALAGAESLSLGCANGRELRDLAGACGAGKFLCWMECRAWSSNSGCTDSTPLQDFTCADPQGNVWHEGDSHCPTCTTTCAPAPAAPSATTSSPSSASSPGTSGAICNGYLTTMYMQGFIGIPPDEACLVLLFQGWTLDTAAKYAVGAVGTFFLGMLTESVIAARRWNQGRTRKFAPAIEAALYMTLYLVQVLFGYFAMLLVMTYSAVIFSAVVLGLAAGHFLLNYKGGPVRSRSTVPNASPGIAASTSALEHEHADPCCKFMEDVQDKDEPTKQTAFVPA